MAEGPFGEQVDTTDNIDVNEICYEEEWQYNTVLQIPNYITDDEIKECCGDIYGRYFLTLEKEPLKKLNEKIGLELADEDLNRLIRLLILEYNQGNGGFIPVEDYILTLRSNALIKMRKYYDKFDHALENQLIDLFENNRSKIEMPPDSSGYVIPQEIQDQFTEKISNVWPKDPEVRANLDEDEIAGCYKKSDELRFDFCNIYAVERACEDSKSLQQRMARLEKRMARLEKRIQRLEDADLVDKDEEEFEQVDAA